MTHAGIADRYDVIVVGSGSAGSTAAITSARTGAHTLLVDRLAFMGGTSTAVLDTFYAFYTPAESPRRVVGGLGWEVVGRRIGEGVATLKLAWEELAVAAGSTSCSTRGPPASVSATGEPRRSASGTRAASAGSRRAIVDA